MPSSRDQLFPDELSEQPQTELRQGKEEVPGGEAEAASEVVEEERVRRRRWEAAACVSGLVTGRRLVRSAPLFQIGTSAQLFQTGTREHQARAGAEAERVGPRSVVPRARGLRVENGPGVAAPQPGGPPPRLATAAARGGRPSPRQGHPPHPERRTATTPGPSLPRGLPGPAHERTQRTEERAPRSIFAISRKAEGPVNPFL